jgi:hypothetical protein
MNEIEKWERALTDMVVCYVLARTDTPGESSVGRLGAQMHHCGSQMTEEKNAKDFPDLNDLYDEWQRDPALELAAARAQAELDGFKGARRDDGTPCTVRGEELFHAALEAREAADKAKRTFGTVLTLAVNAAEMRNAVNLAQVFSLHAGITHDPTYPIFLKDGERTIVTTAPIDSCGYVFGRKSVIEPVLCQFDLLHERHFR